MEIALRGIGVSPGIAIGPALPFRVQSLDVPKFPIQDSVAELERFERAAATVRADLTRLTDQTREEHGDALSGIFRAHLYILDDVVAEIRSRLDKERVNVEYLVDDLIGRYSRMMTRVNDARAQERVADLLDVGTRILGKLLNTELNSLEHIERPSIVVAHDLSPSETANIDIANTLGIATDMSGPTSHTAILARELQIPAVVALRYVGDHTLPGDAIIVDGTNGYVYIRPNAVTLERFVEERKRQEKQRRALLRAEAHERSATLDGVEVPVMANVELPYELRHSLKASTHGIGLYRTEYLFLNRSSLPTEEEQYHSYSQVVAAVKPAPVTLRTIDIGGDKFMSHVPFEPEDNPQLGWRAVRFCLERPDIFKAQLRAMLRSSEHGNVQIMFPMISGLDEFRAVMSVLNDVRADLERRSVPFKKDIKVGSMIEVPSVVMTADQLAQECDFFSIGTNDLIQYALAVDRGNERIAHMYEPAHPSVLRMIRQTVKAAKTAHIPCAICGEMAGDPLFTELLLGLGVDSLSMSAVGIPAVRAEIANTKLATAKAFANRILRLSTAAAVRSSLQRRFERRNAIDAYLAHAMGNGKGKKE